MQPSTPPDHRPRPAVLFRSGALVSLGAASTVIGLYALYTVRAILIRILIALFIAVSLDPAVRWLTGRGMRRGVAVTLIFMLALLLFAAFLISVIPPLVSQGRNLADDLPDYLTRVQRQSSQYRELNDRYNISDQLQGLATNLPGRLGSGLLGFTGRVFGAVFNGLTVLVFTIYFMADMPRIRSGVVRLFPVERRARARQVVDLVVDKVGGYMIGNLIISLIAGVASFIAFTLLGVAFPVPLAFVVAICDLIPMIGATLGAIIGVTVALFSTDLVHTLLVAAFFIAYQQLENYLIAPRVLKTTVELGAAAVLIAGLIGATVLGLVGALMAIPVAAAFNVLLNERLIAHETAAGVALPNPAEAAGAPPAAEVRGSGPPDRG
ncbi:MAG TPA: AI-2E family transporter [Actinomycetota bacterium]|jgi:predicted PurR-regulated permease PerM|nr:AI-2E family transporter [Actinomycetota bacterium]